MTPPRAIVVDPRSAHELLAALVERRPGYVPEWAATPGDPGYALLQIAARFAEAMSVRLNQAPDKHELAFLDLVGQRLGPAQPARVPIAFRLSDGVAAGAAPAGTGIAAAPPPGGSQPIAFETIADAGITAGKLTQLFSLWPGRDEFIDHSVDFAAGNPMHWFSPQEFTTAPHVLYLSHAALLNLSGNVDLRIEVQLARPSFEELALVWEYWDGQVWRGFSTVTTACGGPEAELTDGTLGFTASGVVRLTAQAAKSDQTKVNGVAGYWVRGRLDQPLPVDSAHALPEIDAIRISNIVSQPLLARLAARTIKQLIALRALVSNAATAELTGTLLNEAGQPLAGATVVVSDPNDPSFGAPSSLTEDDGSFSVPVGAFTTVRTLRYGVTFLAVQASVDLDVAPSVTAELTLTIGGLPLEKAYSGATKLDTTKPFYPFGQQPGPGTTFYFSASPAFVKPGASVRLYLPRTQAASDLLSPVDTRDAVSVLTARLAWEYWNGKEWAALTLVSAKEVNADFAVSEIVDFRVPLDLVATDVNGDNGLWMRARLVSGGYGFVRRMSVATTGGGSAEVSFIVTQPPVMAGARVGYSWQFGPFPAEHVFAFNDFAYADRTEAATWPGSTFAPFERMADVTPTVYLGFDQPAPPSSLGIFMDVAEALATEARPRFTWEYWDGAEWFPVTVNDGTADLTAPGILTYIAEEDSAPLARFGTPLHWLRGRLKEDGVPPEVDVAGVYPNAVWAEQRRTFTDVALGTASGQPSEVFRILQSPVLAGEQIEVMELSGPRANVEWRTIALELAGGEDSLVRDLEQELEKEGTQTTVASGVLRLRRDKDKHVIEAWVRWARQDSLFFSGPTDRHYALDRARGLLFFGDGTTGRTLPAGAAVCARRFQSGGGSVGNVAAKAVSQLLGAVSGVEAVFNPHAAEGGSDGESLERFRDRAPSSLRHRGRALTAGDYEAMAREASAAIAVAKAFPTRNAYGRTLPGYVTLRIVPNSAAAQPFPTRGLRDEVLRYLETRAPAGLIAADRVLVEGPEYFPVDVSVTVVPERNDEAGPVETRTRAALETFLHPLRGGPEGKGWSFGRSVYRSDVARVLESVEGLDHASLIELSVNGQLRGEVVLIPSDRLVAIGAIRTRLQGARS